MDRQAQTRFSEFAATRGPKLFRLALVLTADAHTAQDLVQDTLASLFVAWSRVERADDPDAYARRVLINASRRRFRRRRPTEVLSDQLPDVAAADATSAATDGLQTALASLTPGQRRVVALRFLEDLSVEQTASALGCSTGTVKSQTAKALSALRRELALTEESA